MGNRARVPDAAGLPGRRANGTICIGLASGKSLVAETDDVKFAESTTALCAGACSRWRDCLIGVR